MNINLEEYLKNMRMDRNKKFESMIPLENKKDKRDKNFYWGQVCVIDEILFDIKNKMIKII